MSFQIDLNYSSTSQEGDRAESFTPNMNCTLSRKIMMHMLQDNCLSSGKPRLLCEAELCLWVSFDCLAPLCARSQVNKQVIFTQSEPRPEGYKQECRWNLHASCGLWSEVALLLLQFFSSTESWAGLAQNVNTNSFQVPEEAALL